MKLLRKLIAPILAICAVSIFCIGTTYAMFTKNAQENIVISSGEVNLEATISDTVLYSPTLADSDGTVIDDTNCATETNFFCGGTATISSGELSLSNMVPGDKVSFKINYNNLSNINIKYRIMYYDITSYSGSLEFKLIDALVVKNGTNTLISGDCIQPWTLIEVGETIDPTSISVELPTTASSSYIDLSCTLKFSVEAIQGNAYVEDAKTTCNIVCDSTEGEFSTNPFKILRRKDISFECVAGDTTQIKVHAKDGNTILSTFTPAANFRTYLFTLTSEAQDTVKYTFNVNDIGTTKTYTAINDIILTVSSDCCIVEGTKITMGDYTTKPVEDLRYGDMILAYNFFTGMFESTPLIYAFDESCIVDTYKVTLKNGKTITVVNSEDMFDVDERKFFSINYDTYKDLVGRRVLLNNNGSKDYSEITSITHEFKETTFYTLYSRKTLNYVASDIVMIYSVNGYCEKYSITPDLKVDQDAYNVDLTNYGLFSYEDFPMLDKEMFDAFDIATCKFLIGKSVISVEQFNNYMSQFVEEYTTKLPLFKSK